MKTDRVYLLHVRDAIERIRSYTTAGREGFLTDCKTQDAVIRNFEIIGEAVKQVTQSTLDRQPDVPWKQIAGLRDVLIHHYFGVKLDAIWKVVESNLEPLTVAVSDLLASSLPGDEATLT